MVYANLILKDFHFSRHVIVVLTLTETSYLEPYESFMKLMTRPTYLKGSFPTEQKVVKLLIE